MKDKFIYPPRAEVKITANRLSTYDNGEYVGQPKLNGSCGVLIMREGKHLMMNRHGEPMTLVDNTLPFIEHLYKGEGLMVLAGEYLNKNKAGADGSKFNHKFVIWDILTYCNVQLQGETVSDRLDLLNELYGSQEVLLAPQGRLITHPHLYVISEEFYRVQSYVNNFEQLYKEIASIDVMEGFVLKRKAAKLCPMLRESNNFGWQLKCRKETKNYRF